MQPEGKDSEFQDTGLRVGGWSVVSCCGVLRLVDRTGLLVPYVRMVSVKSEVDSPTVVAMEIFATSDDGYIGGVKPKSHGAE